MYRQLVSKGIIKPGYIAMVMGSKADLPHAEKIKSFLEKYELTIELRVLSAHKNGERITEIADALNHCIEPAVVIAIAGRSNGLGGALAANLSIPVINCPPFKDNADIMMNINSSLMMPSNTPALTVIHPDNAALAAVRALNSTLFKDQMNKDIYEIKETLIKDDNDVKN
jgi:phosphoribosylaminoimidazole carboxylase PurE protein